MGQRLISVSNMKNMDCFAFFAFFARHPGLDPGTMQQEPADGIVGHGLRIKSAMTDEDPSPRSAGGRDDRSELRYFTFFKPMVDIRNF